MNGEKLINSKEQPSEAYESWVNSDKREHDFNRWSAVLNSAEDDQNENENDDETKGVKLTPENTRDYFNDRYSENLEMLEQLGDSHIAEVYRSLMEEYPELRIVKLYDDDDMDDNAFFSGDQDVDGMHIPIIGFNFSHKEAYTIEKTREFEHRRPSRDDRLGRKYATKRLAFEVGADWKKCVKNKNLTVDEVLLHEFGHAHDLINNFFRPEYDYYADSVRALCSALNLSFAERTEYMLQSPDGVFEDGLGRHSPEWRMSERRLRAMGIENYDEYLYAVHQYYRDQPDEAYADQFAYDYIMRHHDDYFTHDPAQYDKVYVNREQEMKLDRDFVHILKLHQGLGVEIDKLDDDFNSVEHITGFLATNMYVGKGVYLYENGDHKNCGEKWRICSGISDISMRSTRNEETGEIDSHVFFKDIDGIEYHINTTGEEPEVIASSPEEMMEDLGLQVGDKVQLIEHLPRDADYDDMIDLAKTDSRLERLREGVVAKSDDGVMIECLDKDGEPFFLDCQPVREWKRWYISNYEVLPLPQPLIERAKSSIKSLYPPNGFKDWGSK